MTEPARRRDNARDDPESHGDRATRRAERRRRVQARSFDTTVPSPCIAVCQLDPATDLCIGCQRHVDEIRDWPIMTAEEKRETLTRIEARRGQD